MPILYSKQKPSRSIPVGMADTKRLADELVPAGSGYLNVVKDFPWTLTPKNSTAIVETPFILLTEHYMVQNAINQAFAPYGASITSNPNTPSGVPGLIELSTQQLNANIDRVYQGVFDTNVENETGFKYKFPLFSPQQFSANNAWKKKDILDTIINYQKSGLGLMANILGGAQRLAPGQAVPRAGFGKAASAAARGLEFATNTMQAVPDIIKQMTMLRLQSNNPAAGLLDPPQLWRGSNPREYGFTFYLFNTEATNSTNNTKHILQNWELCYILTYQNALNKRNFFTATPPVFYQVLIPGVHFCKASVMKNISISNVGNVRNLRLAIDGGPETAVNVPDAYKIDITMQDVFMPSKNFLEAVADLNYQQIITTN